MSVIILEHNNPIPVTCFPIDPKKLQDKINYKKWVV